ncbi:MAG: Asp-tRNA(Asn)/Glu-tRNA(Gln) amidotransferase subunit GatC [Syntrophomonadaceae bacterium]|nr:Asp-tRNA(Asn)/Glu-tRNA(Gln) amidotransferase subunit GatC [Syntrophomonadaceae bacterium]
MALTSKEVEHLAILSRLALTDEEKALFAGQMNDILEFADKFNQLDTDNVEPMVYVLPANNVFREDEVIPGPTRDELLTNASAVEEGYFKVPKIL